MRRTDVYFKVELVVDEHDDVRKIAAEIIRYIERVHEVRAAEVQNITERE